MTRRSLFAASEPVAPGAGRVSVASLPPAERMLPPASESAVVEA